VRLLSSFFKTLGYKSPLSASTVADQYQSLEGVVKARLCVSDDALAAKKLKELTEKKDNISDVELNLYKSAWNLITSEQQQTIISTIASIYNLSPDDLKRMIANK